MKNADIPSDVLSEIRLRFESTPEVHAMRTRQQYAQLQGNYDFALEIGRKIDDLFVVVLDKYMNQTEHEVKTLDTEAYDIPKKDKEEMIEKIVVLFMACDIIDWAILDLNSILHRSKPDIDITMFSDIKQTAELARKKLDFLQKNGDYMDDLIWAEKSDDMYNMIQSKARAIIRKRKTSKDWGKNMQRLK